MKIFIQWLGGGLFMAACLMLVTPAHADGMSYTSPPETSVELPAVSGPNAKIDFSGISSDGDAGAAISGAISTPLRHDLGLQIDGFGAAADDTSIAGAGAHLFWRNPSYALIGIYADIAHYEKGDIDEDVGRVAAEIELYRGQVSFETIVGGLYGADFDSAFFIETDLAYYVHSDLRLSGGFKLYDGESFGAAGFEYAVGRWHEGASIFGDALIGAEDYSSFRLGLRYYTGAAKPLIERHRQDDPQVRTPLGVGAVIPESKNTGGVIDPPEPPPEPPLPPS